MTDKMMKFVCLSIRKGLLLFIAFFLTGSVCGQADTLLQRLFLIGDAGELKEGRQPVLDWLTKHVDWNDERNVALFLGDNIYPDGLPGEGDPQYPSTKRVLDYEISLVKGKKGKAFFIPGNHDWKGGKIGGWERAVNQVNYINGLQAANIQAWPLNGCPGPIPVELNEKVVLVMMDTQWFLHLHDKPGPESSCAARSMEEFSAELRQIVETHSNQLLVLVMHHPMYTYGVHGGAYGLKQHLFPFEEAIKGLYIPLPVLGSVYPLARGLFGSLQDTYHPLYRTMITEIEKVLKDHPNPLTVAGHEHSLQLIVKDSIPHIVSGSAAKLTRLRKGKNSLFSILDYGFSVIEVSKSGKVEVKFYNLQNQNLNTPLFTKQLKQIVPTTPKASLDTLLPDFGSVEVQAGREMKAGEMGAFFWGKNYRKEWMQKISLPVLDIGKESGGLIPVRQEGAQLSKTLQLVDKNGKEWMLRSIEKLPEVVIPANLRSALSKETLANGVSGAYPYASLSVPVLERAAGIPSLKRKLVYVPDDPRLDRFRTGFKNTLAFLEEREPEKVSKTLSTNDLLLLLAKDNNHHVNQKAVLWARLMDNFVMDFDRHEGKWRWATKDTGSEKVFYPIGHDHDQAFFKSEGLFTSLLHHSWIIPETQGFRPKAKNIQTFNKAARNFDRFFLNELSLEDWQISVDSFLAGMTDTVLREALQQQPAAIRQFSGQKIIDQLQKRRAYFREEMLNYYRFIAATVDVVGTNNKELVSIEKRNDGRVLVTINKIEHSGLVSAKLYERLLDPVITKEIRIYALEGDDSLVVKGGTTTIKIRLIGGPGKDDFINESGGKGVKVYDATFEENTFTGAGFDNKNVSDPEVNRYNFMGFRYNYIHPRLMGAYNKDDGAVVGLTLEYFKHGFRKEPYGMRQYLQAEKALGIGSYRFYYEADYVKAIKDFDVSVRADYRGPVHVTNYFGLGNTTVFDKAKGIDYYRTRYELGNVALLVGMQLQSWMRIGLGPTYQFINFHQQYNTGKFVADVNNNGGSTASLFKDYHYLGAEARLDINSRNSPVLPTRGALIQAYARPLFGLNPGSSTVVQSGLDIRIFMSFLPQTPFVFATRVGMGRNFGKYVFQQAQYLSGKDNLRGFRRERFAGRSMLFNNAEVRLKLADFPFYIFSGSAGVLAFHDIGRVWSDGETTGRWHNGYGGGIWVSPLRRFVIVGSLAFSKEERGLPLLTMGFQF